VRGFADYLVRELPKELDHNMTWDACLKGWSWKASFQKERPGENSVCVCVCVCD